MLGHEGYPGTTQLLAKTPKSNSVPRSVSASSVHAAPYLRSDPSHSTHIPTALQNPSGTFPESASSKSLPFREEIVLLAGTQWLCTRGAEHALCGALVSTFYIYPSLTQCTCRAHTRSPTQLQIAHLPSISPLRAIPAS